MPTSRLKRRSPRRLGAALAVAGALALVLTGCVGTAEPTPTPTATEAAPIFASDEEALAAAERTYALFLAASATATNTGGDDLEDLARVAAGDALDAQLKVVEDFKRDGLVTSGERRFSTHELQEVAQDVVGGAAISFYVCDDLRAVDVLDQGGVSVVAPNRVVDVPYLVVAEGKSEADLMITTKQLWERESFCG